MRLWLAAMVVACGNSPAVPDSAGGGPEGIPPRICGVTENPCPDCIYCGLRDSFCFGPQPDFTAGVGSCDTMPVTGTLTMMVGSDAFTADSVAAAVVEDGAIVEGHAGDKVIALFMPTTPGTYACGSPPPWMQLEYIDTTAYFNRPVQDRPACTMDVTSVGDVGQRIEGSFSGTAVDASTGTTTVTLSNGSFSVERVPYP